LEENKRDWDNRYNSIREALARAGSTAERLELIRQLDAMALEEINKLRRVFPASGQNILPKRDRPWDEGLSASEIKDPDIRQNHDKGYFHGTSLGVLLASALLRGTLGGITGLKMDRASTEAGTRLEALFFTSKGLYGEKKEGEENFDEFGMPLGGVLDPFAEAFLTSGTYSAITSRPARALSAYYAFRLEWEKRRQNGELAAPDFDFPSIDLFLIRAVMKVDKIPGVGFGHGYPENVTTNPVYLPGVVVMLDADMLLPDWGTLPSTVLANNDPENLVANYTTRDAMTGEYIPKDEVMRNLQEDADRLMKDKINSLVYSIGNFAAGTRNWVSIEDIFKRVYARIPVTLTMSPAEIEQRFPYTAPDPPAQEAAVPLIFNDYTPVSDSGVTIKDRFVESEYSNSCSWLMLRIGPDGQYYLQSTIRSGENLEWNSGLQWNAALGRDLDVAIAVFNHFGTIKKVDLLRSRIKFSEDSQKIDAEIEGLVRSLSSKAVDRGGDDSDQGPGPGGIDFRFLPIVTQSLVNLKADIRGIPTGSLQRMDLTKEWSDIQRLVASGITPSAERLKDYLAASSFKGSLGKDMRKIISCISDVLRMQEQSCVLADPALKDMLIVLGSGRSAEELKLVFAK